MSDLPKRVKIKEVGPREGFQFEKGAISLADEDLAGRRALRHRPGDHRVHLVRQPEVGAPDGRRRARWWPASSGRPAWPTRRSGSTRPGWSGPRKHRDSLALRPMFGVAATDTFMRKNTNRSVDERLEELPGLGRALPGARHGLARRGRDGGVRLQLRGRRGAHARRDACSQKVEQQGAGLRLPPRRHQPRRHDGLGQPAPDQAPGRRGARALAERRRSSSTCTTRARWPSPTWSPPWRWASTTSTARWPAWAAARSPPTRAPPATSPPRTWCSCARRWASRPASTSTR